MRRAWKVFWIATTPIALTVLLSSPSRGVEAEASDNRATEIEPHEFVTDNPILNFSSFSYNGKDALGNRMTPEDPLPKMPPPFSMALVNFAILLFLVGKGAGPSIARHVRDRHALIRDALQEGTRLREAAKKQLDEYTAKLKSLDSEITALVAGIRSEAESEKKRIIAEAEARSERMRRDAEQQIQAEIQRVRMTLEREAVEAAITIAERVLREKTNETDQHALADKFVKNLQDVAAKGRLIA